MGQGVEVSDTANSDPTAQELVQTGWHKAAASLDLPRRALLRVAIRGKEVLLSRLEDGTPAACHPLCPHENAPLVEGSVYMGAIDCPLHHYLYDLRSGCNRYPRNVFPADKVAELAPLRMYPTYEGDGVLWVKIEAPP